MYADFMIFFHYGCMVGDDLIKKFKQTYNFLQKLSSVTDYITDKNAIWLPLLITRYVGVTVQSVMTAPLLFHNIPKYPPPPLSQMSYNDNFHHTSLTHIRLVYLRIGVCETVICYTSMIFKTVY